MCKKWMDTRKILLEQQLARRDYFLEKKLYSFRQGQQSKLFLHTDKDHLQVRIGHAKEEDSQVKVREPRVDTDSGKAATVFQVQSFD